MVGVTGGEAEWVAESVLNLGYQVCHIFFLNCSLDLFALKQNLFLVNLFLKSSIKKSVKIL